MDPCKESIVFCFFFVFFFNVEGIPSLMISFLLKEGLTKALRQPESCFFFFFFFFFCGFFWNMSSQLKNRTVSMWQKKQNVPLPFWEIIDYFCVEPWAVARIAQVLTDLNQLFVFSSVSALLNIISKFCFWQHLLCSN